MTASPAVPVPVRFSFDQPWATISFGKSLTLVLEAATDCAKIIRTATRQKKAMLMITQSIVLRSCPAGPSLQALFFSRNNKHIYSQIHPPRARVVGIAVSWSACLSAYEERSLKSSQQSLFHLYRFYYIAPESMTDPCAVRPKC